MATPEDLLREAAEVARATREALQQQENERVRREVEVKAREALIAEANAIRNRRQT